MGDKGTTTLNREITVPSAGIKKQEATFDNQSLSLSTNMDTEAKIMKR
jgi:hypothetical protein